MTTRPSQPAGPYDAYRTGPFVHVTDYLRVLSRRRWSAGLVVLVVFVAGAISTLKTTPLYEASAQIQIEKEASRASSLTTVLDPSDAYVDEDFYLTQHKILQSRSLAKSALVSLGRLHPGSAGAAPESSSPTPWRGVGGWLMNLLGAPKRIAPPAPDETTAESQAISGFLNGLTVAPVRNTHLVDVKYQSPDPVVAAQSANAVAKQYIAQSLEARLSASRDASEYLASQLEEQRAKLEQSERALQDYKEKNDAVALDDRQNTVVQKLSEINAQVTQAQGDRIAKESTYTALQKLAGDPDKLLSFPPILQNPGVQRLKGEISTLTQERASLAGLGSEHPAVAAKERALKDAKDRLAGEVQRVVDAIRTDYQTAVSKEQMLRRALDQANADAITLGKKSAEYMALQREAVSNRTLYDTLLQRAKETGVAGEYKGTNIRIVDLAEVPREPVLPRTGRDLLIALVIGLTLGCGLAFFLEYLDNRIRTPDEIKAHLGLPFLGIVPAVPQDRARGDDDPILLEQGAPPAFSEAIRALRTAVVFSSVADGARSVVVTSAAPSEGKTLVSTNLAVALAHAGQRTLLVDADMRRPRVHAVFGCSQEPGLSNVLVGTARLHAAVRPTRTPRLFLISSGHLPPNPAELLGSHRYLELLADLEHQFEWIIIDAPPIMPVTDAAVVANRSTGVLYVVGAEMTSRSVAARAVEQLQAARVHFIGAVLNRVNLDRHAYYYSGYYRKDYARVYEHTR